MCGIIIAKNHSKNKKPVNEWVIDQLEDQINRGQQGFGVVFVDENGKYKITRSTEIAKTLINLYQNPSQFIALHHRLPTSSSNKLKQTHPIVVDNKILKHKYLIMHNGTVFNEDDIKKIHEKLGFKYTTEIKAEKMEGYAEYSSTYNENSFNDSETVAIELALFIEKKIPKIRVSASIACVILQIDKKKETINKIFYCRNRNPLNLHQSKGEIRISSEGIGKEVKADMLYSINLKDHKIAKRRLYNEEEEKEKAIEQEYAEQPTQIGYQPYDTSANQQKLLHFNDTEYDEDSDWSQEYEKEHIIDKSTEIIEYIVEAFFDQIRTENDLSLIDINESILEFTNQMKEEMKRVYEELTISAGTQEKAKEQKTANLFPETKKAKTKTT